MGLRLGALGLCALVPCSLAWRATFFIGGEFQGDEWGAHGNIAQCEYTSPLSTEASAEVRCRAMGDGLPNGRVYAIAAPRSDRVYATGSFRGGDPKLVHIAWWDGKGWRPLGGGLEGGVGRAIATLHGKVFVVGDFTRAGGVRALHAAVWDGRSWAALADGTGPRSSLGGSANALAVMGTGAVVVGGEFPTTLGDTTMQFLSVWSPQRATWVPTNPDPFPHPVNALARVRGAFGEDDSLFVAGRFDVRQFHFAQQRWIVKLRKPRRVFESEFRINTVAVQNFTRPFTRDAEQCVWVGGFFEGAAVVRNRVERDVDDVFHLTRWCRSTNQWEAVPHTFAKVQVLALAASANGEIVAGWEHGFGVWDWTMRRTAVFHIPQGGVWAAAFLHQLAPAHEVHEALEAYEKRPSHPQDTEPRVELVESLAETAKIGHQDTSEEGDDVESACEAEADSSQGQSGDSSDAEDLSPFKETEECADVPHDSLPKRDPETNRLQRIAFGERTRLERSQQSLFVKLARTVNIDLVGRVELETLEAIDDALVALFNVSQLVVLVGVGLVAWGKVESWLFD